MRGAGVRIEGGEGFGVEVFGVAVEFDEVLPRSEAKRSKAKQSEELVRTNSNVLVNTLKIH